MQDIELENAIKQIKDANENGFVLFFNKTFHYVYVRAKYIFPNIVECREFIKSVYLYSYLHIGNFTSDHDLDQWLSYNILCCYQSILVQNGIEAFNETTKDRTYSTALIPEGSISEHCMNKDTCCRILAKHIQSLPALPKILFLSFYHDGLETNKLAAAFQCDEASILSILEKTKNHLYTSYQNSPVDDGQLLYPFGMQFVYHALEIQNLKYASTKEFARLVWDSIASELTFRRRPRKKVLTLPMFLLFSLLILAFIIVTMFSHDSFSSQKSDTSKKQPGNSIYESTESDFSSEQNEIKPSSTTTIKDENGNVTTYDEDGSEISAPTTHNTKEPEQEDTNTNVSTNSGSSETSNSSTDNNENSTESTLAHQPDAPTVNTPSVEAPTVIAPSVAPPTVNVPTPPDAPSESKN